ncbi:cysteine desulfurase-like protein [Planctomicrobium piriforme]|uniref:Cysteine desulfurase family protein, VC1184 subfamily n=1 Tax=Planctomicrobium piriforme TaxID=1576369 RepID=A0A1I3S522_9PLAN|nr:cysteine desulfurase-like protein [Planctomicrobium piriforme]SFJ53884.1 cysteine desulfurase family protein, VC1184 subfamily [Planctomicrobium piriforme]
MFSLERIRDQFPALKRELNGQPIVYFDGPAGSQVPRCVAEAITQYLYQGTANCSGPFASSRDSDEMLRQARLAVADLVQCEDADEIVFGANMTTLTFALSRTLAKTWQSGDEVIVSRLDHDANVTPWVLAAERAGAIVRHIDFQKEDCTLDQAQFASLLNERTKLVAFCGASNATGTINPIQAMCSAARQSGALTFIDAVHLAPHRRLNVSEWVCDFLVCSGYKFFGPHVASLWGRRELLERLQPDKLRPAPNTLPGKWMTGTQNHEGIAGLLAAIEYLANLSEAPVSVPRKQRLDAAFELIASHEATLSQRMLAGLQTLSGFRVWGIADMNRLGERVPTFSLTHAKWPAKELARRLSDAGVFCWGGHHYALPFTTSAGLEPEGTLRLGALHYNSVAEVDRCLHVLEAGVLR